jgi:leader peptidase (prepilin peptidase)/N-methyltransferase
MIESWLVPIWDSTIPIALAAEIGVVAAIASLFLMRHCFAVCEVPQRWPWAPALATGLLVTGYAWLMLEYHVERIDEVRPGPVWDRLRVIHHATLIVLLTAATVTDWKTTYIPDLIAWIGLPLGIGLATLSGDLQVSHVWVDWNQAIPRFSGPYLPEWMKSHPHLHGFAWSTLGALCGAALCIGVRFISRKALGQPALGPGDTFLMATIGSYLGWQPTVIAFLIAPVLAIGLGLAIRAVSGRTYIPYGPFLAAAAVIVLCSWRWIWEFESRLGSAFGDDRKPTFSVRRLFGDPAMLLGIAGVVIVALAIALRWKRWQSEWNVNRPSSRQP